MVIYLPLFTSMIFLLFFAVCFSCDSCCCVMRNWRFAWHSMWISEITTTTKESQIKLMIVQNSHRLFHSILLSSSAPGPGILAAVSLLRTARCSFVRTYFKWILTEIRKNYFLMWMNTLLTTHHLLPIVTNLFRIFSMWQQMCDNVCKKTVPFAMNSKCRLDAEL